MADITLVDAHYNTPPDILAVHTLAWAPTAGAGSLIVVQLEWEGRTLSVVSVEDDRGNTYQSAGEAILGAGSDDRVLHTYYAFNCGALSGAQTVTVTLSDAALCYFSVEVYANADTNDPYVMSDGASNAAADDFTAGTAIPDQNGCLILASIIQEVAPV